MTLASQNSIPYTGLTNSVLVVPVDWPSRDREPYFGNIPFTGQSKNYKSAELTCVGITISSSGKTSVSVNAVLGYVRSVIRGKAYPVKPTQATFHSAKATITSIETLVDSIKATLTSSVAFIRSTKDTIIPKGASFARFLIFKLLPRYTITKRIVVPALSADLLPTAA